MPIETNAIEFAQTVFKKAEFVKKSFENLAINEAQWLAKRLYTETRNVAPKQSDISADVQKQGWRIPEKFPDGRIGRGTPDQWLGVALASLPRRRGRKSKARLAQEAAILSSRPTLQQMQAFVIKHRSRAIGYVATGWLGAIEDLGGSPQGRVDKSRGHAEIQNQNEILIINSTPGISSVEQKHGIVRKAINAQISYLNAYIARKVSESLAKAA